MIWRSPDYGAVIGWLARWRWVRRWLGGTWRRGFLVEHYPDVGRVSYDWLDAHTKETDDAP